MSEIFVNDEGIMTAARKRHGDSSISQQLQAEKSAKNREWEMDAENVFKNVESIKQHALYLTHALTIDYRLSSVAKDCLNMQINELINKVPSHMMNPKHIGYINKIVQSGVTDFIENSGIQKKA